VVGLEADDIGEAQELQNLASSGSCTPHLGQLANSSPETYSSIGIRPFVAPLNGHDYSSIEVSPFLFIASS